MDIDHIAKLAKLTLKTEEKEMLSRQFAGILEQFDVLDTLEAPENTAHYQATSVPLLRDDTAVSVEPTKQDALLDQSTYRDGRFLRLPSVF